MRRGAARASPGKIDPLPDKGIGETMIRLVIGKAGLDGHDRGAKIVARILRDAGVEVIYSGLHATPEEIVHTAVQEDADGIGLSVLSGAHLTLFSRVLELLEQEGADILVFGGGTIPREDIPVLRAAGVAAVFPSGTSAETLVDWVEATFSGVRRSRTI